MYEYVPLDDPGCSLTRILRQPFRGGLAPRRETVTGDYHHGGIGLPAYCPGIDEPDPMIPWEQDLPRAC